MENEKLYPKEIQKGVIFYRNVAKGFGDTDAVDIDVDSRLKEVEIWCDLLMKDSKKSFPNVEKLIIKSNVFEISIPNSLFPNVKWVESENARFKTGSCLIQTGFSISNILLNTFCKKPGEAIETDGVLAIKNGAFSGCESTNMTDGINVLFSDDIEPDSFAGSAFEQLPFVNGVKMANNIVIDIDKTAGEVIIPDADCRKAIFLPGVNLSGIKKLIVHRYSTAMQVGSDTGLPEILILDTDETLSGEEVREVAHRRAYAVSYLKYFSILNYAYKEIDGVIYSKDGKVVVACSMELEHVTIPEGTEIIGYDAFKKCKLKSVMLPDSLTEIRSEAFCGCRNLQSVKLGNSVNIIEAGAFSECRSLSEIDIPAGTKAIENYAFSNSGLERVELREGLLLLGRQAFSGTNIKSISLPASIEDMGYNCIGTKAEEVRLSAFTDCFAKACIVTSGPFDLGDKILKVFCNGKYLYLPRYIIPSMSSAAIDVIKYFFSNPDLKSVNMWRYAGSLFCQRKTALLEYLDFGSEFPQKHLEEDSYYILSTMVMPSEHDEELASKLVKTGLVPDKVLMEILPKAKEAEMPVLQAYILNQLNQGNHENHGNYGSVSEEKNPYSL